jgi:hypothetical protein
MVVRRKGKEGGVKTTFNAVERLKAVAHRLNVVRIAGFLLLDFASLLNISC